MSLKKINKLLVANRGEIAIRIFRAATELKIRTVAVYTHEDRYSLHRFKSDEAYKIGKDDDPLKPYLDIEEIINVAKQQGIDAIHPGYGFLSENVTFAKRCEEEGIKFVGPHHRVMQKLGDKISAKIIAKQTQVPMIEDSQKDLNSVEVAIEEAERIGYPIMLKASAGGGGRGMRVVRSTEQLRNAYREARNEAKTAFGIDTVFIEKFVENPKHIEVQILGDEHGSLVHLFERDCSVQRRFQKVVEVAPCISIKQETKDKLYAYALKLTQHVGYTNAGTVEFLVDKKENIYFIEVNPRVQVEHTITEEITGIDIVRSQILVASGHKLSDPCIGIENQESLECHGYAIQCRITTEDPKENFKPDYGTIIAYRNAAGMGIRLDEGSSYSGAQISPFFDSMLVKVSAWGRSLSGAADRLVRALAEFRIRGVKTNVQFLSNVVSHPVFKKGNCTVQFIENHPELFDFERRMDRGTKSLRFLADIIVNGNKDVKYVNKSKEFCTPIVPDFDPYATYPKGTKDILTELGADGFVQWLKNQRSIQFTDTTFRDAHQSLLATRVRTTDMLQVAESYVKNNPNIFSMEVWGGATFDVCMRFLKEDPWTRLQLFREAMPNVLLQMLIRSSNAVGYAAYPDNLVSTFIEKSWENGIDVFRIFDSLNWLDSMKLSIQTVRERTGGLAEACICYTGDISNKERTKYTLNYYLDLAKRLEDEGAHILGIKDMAGLLKPYAAQELIARLKKTIDIPIHLHTHDTSSVQSATYLKAIEVGVDVVDVALSSMSGLTSQPNFNSIASMIQGHPRSPKISIDSLNDFSTYWETVREYYYPFESELKAGTAEVYEHEIPGGQYSNLRPQARGLGLEDQFETVKKNYGIVNHLFGELVKVTPSSKVVGDMALFMTSNGYTAEDIQTRGDNISFPESVVNFFKGDLGQPYKGFPKHIQNLILKDVKPYTDRPNAHLKPIDFEKELTAFKQKFGDKKTLLDLLSYTLYPKVYESFHKHQEAYGSVMSIPTLAFFYGLKNNQEIIIKIDEGKNIIVELLNVSEPDDSGYRRVSFKLNGQNRSIEVQDRSLNIEVKKNKKIEKEGDIGAPLQGRLTKVLVAAEQKVQKNTPLFIIEAMKMESTIVAPSIGTIKKIHLSEGLMVEQDDLIIDFESE